MLIFTFQNVDYYMNWSIVTNGNDLILGFFKREKKEQTKRNN
jgi:hypothetical protein